MRYLLLLTVVGCGPRIVSSTPRSVTVDGVNESTIGKATELAQDECAKSGRDAEQISGDDMARGFATKSITFRCVDSVTATADVTPRAEAKPASADTPKDRRTVIGERPLLCAVTAPDVGACFLDENACKAELEKTGAPNCEEKSAGSCFNATKSLDGTKLTVCAVSIKDCEARRQNYATDPDYTVTGCGIYRAQKGK